VLWGQSKNLFAPVCASAAFKKDEIGKRDERFIEVNNAPQLEVMQPLWSGYSGVVGLPSVVGPMDRIGHLPMGYQAICWSRKRLHYTGVH